MRQVKPHEKKAAQSSKARCCLLSLSRSCFCISSLPKELGTLREELQPHLHGPLLPRPGAAQSPGELVALQPRQRGH